MVGIGPEGVRCAQYDDYTVLLSNFDTMAANTVIKLTLKLLAIDG